MQRVQWIIVILFCITYGAILPVASHNPFAGISGQYCKISRCCPKRLDLCSAPIFGTLCYCDEFCNRTVNSDCCPDYWSHCKGIEVPSAITACDVDRTMDNCNLILCKCKLDGFNTNAECKTHRCIIEPDLIDSINTLSNTNEKYGWRATNYSQFWGRKLTEGIRLRLGTLKPQRMVLNMQSVRMTQNVVRIPLAFDANVAWPNLISKVEDQGWCGASWAISTAAVASDRFAVQSNGGVVPHLSAQQLLSCQIRRQQSCNGGYLDRAWNYFRKFGLMDNKCFPYVGEGKSKEPSKKTLQKRQKGHQCSSPVCMNPVRRYQVGPAYRLGNETDIMQEILLSGPVQATMKVYHDFFSYKNGIYRHVRHSEQYESGYHSVRIVGWGQDYTPMGVVKFWRVANSWGRNWGENGYFRIVKGVNECEIESFVLGTWPDIDKSSSATISNNIPRFWR